MKNRSFPLKSWRNSSVSYTHLRAASYKKELARIYKMSSAKKAFMVRQKLPNLKMALEECDRDMRKDIDELKHKYGIHY